MKGETISSLRIVKDHLNRIGGVVKFEVTRDVLTFVDGSRKKYFADLAKQKEAEKKEAREKQKAQGEKESAQRLETTRKQHEKEVLRLKTIIKTANELIEGGNLELNSVLAKDTIKRNDIVACHAKIDMGLDRKRKSEAQLDELTAKLRKLS